MWLAHYLPAWSSRAATAATYDIRDSCLHLSIPPDQGPWCADDHTPPLRVSGIQSGSFSGPVGSTIGQQPYREGLLVREEQESTKDVGLDELGIGADGLDDGMGSVIAVASPYPPLAPPTAPTVFALGRPLPRPAVPRRPATRTRPVRTKHAQGLRRRGKARAQRPRFGASCRRLVKHRLGPLRMVG